MYYSCIIMQMQQAITIIPLQVQCQVEEKGSTVSLSLQVGEGLLAQYIETLAPQDWLPSAMSCLYSLSCRGCVYTFEHRYVLSDMDHSELIRFLKSYISTFVLYQVSYHPAKHQGQINNLLGQLQGNDRIISSRQVKGDQTEKVILLAFKRQKDELQVHWRALANFKEDTVVFAMDDYLEKSKLRPDEYEPFMQGLLRHYETDIHKYLHKKLKKLGLDHDFLIQKIRMLRSSEVPADQKNRIKYGIAIEAVIKAISLVKAYQFLEYWVNKMNWILLEVDEIHCCPKEHLTDWFIRRHNMRSILVSSAHRQPEGASERVVVFAPLMDKPHLEKELRTTTHLITGRQFNVTGRQERADVEIENRFHLVFKYKKEFERFMAGEQGGQSNLRMKIYQEYILVDCDPLGQERIRDQIKEFLEIYQEEDVPIKEFKTPFHIAIFKHFYSGLIRTKPIKIYAVDDQLYRHNSKQVSEQAETEITEIYKLMRRELVYKPLFKPLPHREAYFDVSTAPPDWMTPECLLNSRFQVGDKLLVSLRSYGSLVNGDSVCIFLLETLDQCRQLKEILREEEISYTEERMKKLGIIKVSLRYSRYFDSIVIWFVGSHFKNKRDHSSNSHLRKDIENLLNNSDSRTQYNFMLPMGSAAILERLLPPLFDILLKSCHFDNARRKEVTFYTNCQQGPSLRKGFVEQLRRLKRELNVERVTDLDLRLEDLQKIVQFSYCELKYYEQGVTKCALPANSFIFSRELLKKGKTPIFLPADDESRYPEYVVCFYSEEVYQIKQGTVRKLKQRMGELQILYELATLIKKYFQMLDYLVLFGILDWGIFSQRLFYAESREDMYELLGELEIDLREKKINLKAGGSRVKYKLVNNQFLELYRVETHPDKLYELQQLKKATIL